MAKDNDKVPGSVRISDEVVLICCTNAVLKTGGVSSLAGQKGFRGSQNPSQGVKMDRDDDYVSFDISIIVDFNVKIPQVAWDVQVNVKNEVETITGLKVREVNIHVQGVNIESEEESDD